MSEIITDKINDNKISEEPEKDTVFDIVLSFLAAFSFAFTVCFYIPYETLATNTISMDFPLSVAVTVFLIFAGLVLAVLFFVLSLLRGRWRKIISSLIIGLAFCAYIQSTFMNSGIGSLTGDKVDWDSMIGMMFLTGFVWLAILAVVFIILFVFPKAWKTVMTVMCIMLIVMQGTGFIGVLTSQDNKKNTEIEYVLTKDNMVDYSGKHNVFLFCLDRLDQGYIEEVEKRDPTFFDDLDGFLQYIDATSCFYRTLPGSNHLLTSYDKTAYKESLTDFFDHSWNYDNRHILNDLDRAGIEINLFNQFKIMFGDGKPYVNIVNNMVDSNANIDRMRLFSNVWQLSMFRMMPTAIKPAFWEGASNVNEGIVLDTNEFTWDEWNYDDIIDDMTASNSKPEFNFYHFSGSHAPYRLDENGKRLPDGEESDAATQTMGCFNMLKRAFAKMKELGIYDDSAIIITGDHGKINYDSRPLDGAERLGLFYKAPGAHDEPMIKSLTPVSQDNIPPTILKDFGLDYENYGMTLDEVNAENTKVRYTHKTVTVDGKEKKMYTYKVTGRAADWDNWEVEKIEDIFYSYN